MHTYLVPLGMPPEAQAFVPQSRPILSLQPSLPPYPLHISSRMPLRPLEPNRVKTKLSIFTSLYVVFFRCALCRAKKMSTAYIDMEVT